MHYIKVHPRIKVTTYIIKSLLIRETGLENNEIYIYHLY